MTTNPYQPSEKSELPTAGSPSPGSPVWALVRSVLGMIAGVFVGAFVVALIEIPGWMLHPVPPEIDLSDAEALKAHATKAPFAAQLCVAIAWVAGPLVGSFIAAAIARWGWFGHGMIVAGVFLAFVVLTVRTFPHPTWMTLVGVLGPLAAGWIGSAVAEWLLTAKGPNPKPYDMRQKNMAC